MTQADAPPQGERLLSDFATAVTHGLSARSKNVPCRFLYDARGSELFEDITRLEEYYPTRTEIGLLQAHAQDIAEAAGPGCAVIEFGSGSSRKTHIVLDALEDVAAYVPIDISDDALDDAALRLASHYPHLVIAPLHADFVRVTALPRALRGTPKLGFFPGSTIGNFTRDEAEIFLTNAARLLEREGALLIGVDLKKDAAILEPAYDDAQGVTAAFNLNLLERINRELGGTFDIAGFRHEARYNAEGGRMEMYLVSLADQEAQVLGRRYRFTRGERIHTEYSHKYSVAEFGALAGRAGWTTDTVWTDPDDLFSLHFLTQAERIIPKSA